MGSNENKPKICNSDHNNMNSKYCPKCGKLIHTNIKSPDCSNRIHEEFKEESYKFDWCTHCGIKL